MKLKLSLFRNYSIICIGSVNNIEKSVDMIISFGIKTKWTKIRPNSDHFWANGLTSDRLRKIRSEWQQCISPHTLVRSFFCLEENKDQLLINGPSIKQVSRLYKSTKISIYFTYFLGGYNTHYGLGAIVAQKNLN